MAKHPGFLWHLAHQEHGFSGLDADALRAVARKQWPKLTEQEIDDAVEAAIEWREQTQRRVDPAELEQPQRERTMPSKDDLKTFLTKSLTADPARDNDQLEALATERFGSVNRRRLGALAGQVRRELEDESSTNGAMRPNPGRPKSDPPKDPSAGDAEPDPAPATESVEGAGQVPARVGETKPERVDDQEEDYPEARVERSGHLRSELRLGRRTDRVQVDVDPKSGRARLFLDVEVDRVSAYRIQAIALDQLADAAEAEVA